jgi:putative MFS transporter
MKYRGKGLLLLNFFISIGKIYGVFLAYFFLKSFTEGDWKSMMIMSSLPNIIVLYGVVNHIQESPRYLIAKGRFEEAFRIINLMIIKNNGEQSQLLT